MAAFCLTKQATEKLKMALKSRELDPFKMAEMTSEQRRSALAKHIGDDNAKEVNALFESKLLLKNKQQGYITWAKKIAGLTPEARRDLEARINKLDRVLNPKEEEKFLEDLASKRLGVHVTEGEAKTIADLYKKIQDAEQLKDPKTLEFPSEKDRLNYGAARIALRNYMNDLKNTAQSLRVGERLLPKNYVKNASDIAGLAKSAKASLDNSAIFRQGWKTLWTNPGIWLKNAAKSFVDFAKTVKDKDKVIDGIMADLISRPNYDKYVKAKLAIGNIEEAFPTGLPEKIPALGRLFKASETAFTGFVYRQRADIMDAYLKIAEKSGVDIKNPEELIGIGKVINSLTGRGDLGKLEPAANVVNNVFFSPRFLKSNIDLLTAHAFDKDITPFARKKAAVNLVKVIVGTAAVLTIAKALNPDSVETDPRSSDFGKIKIGDTRFDVSGGIASIITLAARQLNGSTKSSTTGKLTSLTSGEFGQPTRFDSVIDFFSNKLSPAASIVKDLLKGEDFQGNKLTVKGELNNLLTPLPIANALELSQDQNSAPILLAIMADALGIGTNTYGKSTTDWNKGNGAELTQFKDQVGQKEFDTANKEFNTEYDKWFQSIVKDPEYQKLSDDGKQSLITKAKDKIRNDVFLNHDFVYEKEVDTDEQIDEKDTIESLLP